MPEKQRKYPVPSIVAGRAHSEGELGEKWLEKLDALVDKLAEKWHIHVGESLNGGSHALVCAAESDDGVSCILKIELPDVEERQFLCGVDAMRVADGHGYAKLLACDVENRACLLERLGKPLRLSGLDADRQMEIICAALTETWKMPVQDAVLQDGGVQWFRDFIKDAWLELGQPCSEKVITQAMCYLDHRETCEKPAEYVLVHGDAHNNNMLQVPADPGRYKLIDSEGLFYEKCYDLGVLMREWPEEYENDPIVEGRERSEFLHRLTGVDADAIWEWGFIQMVSTALVLLQIGNAVLANRMLRIAEAWCE